MFFIINLDNPYLVSQLFTFFHIHLIKLQIILLLILSETTCDIFPYTFSGQNCTSCTLIQFIFPSYP